MVVAVVIFAVVIAAVVIAAVVIAVVVVVVPGWGQLSSQDRRHHLLKKQRILYGKTPSEMDNLYTNEA